MVIVQSREFMRKVMTRMFVCEVMRSERREGQTASVISLLQSLLAFSLTNGRAQG